MDRLNLDWLRDMHKKDTQVPAACVVGEPVYTVFLADFLKMPDVNFFEIAMVDAQIHALLN